MEYIVLIGDIIASKEISNRLNFQKKFTDVLVKPNRTFHNSMISPLTLTIGDEFQAVLWEAAYMFNIMGMIERDIPSVALRYGVGLGTIDTEINSESAIGMDGPAFHFARTAVEIARKEGKIFHFGCDDDVVTERINVMLGWLDITLKKWTPQRKEIFYQYNEKKTQKEIARMMGITQPAVSQNINDSAFKQVAATQNVIEKELNIILQDKS
ncbi:MAG: SatD family protein [Calditrichaceae bacterium]